MVFRSSIFIYILTIFTLVNSKWTKMSIANILTTQHCAQKGFNVCSKSYKNVKALPVCGKNFSKFLSSADIDGDYENSTNERFEICEVFSAVSSKPIYCFFTSYLHLLQLF